MRNHYRNHAYYYDPTAGEAITNISREELRRRHKRDKKAQRSFDKAPAVKYLKPRIATEEISCNR